MPFQSYETPFISYAQAREDVVLLRSLRNVPVAEGFYIDVGAFDPNQDSVTRAFYDAGWRGINIEPSPKLMQPFYTDRPRDINLEVAASAVAGELTFYPNGNGQLGTLEERYADGAASQRVQARTLTDICDEYAPQQIHFLKIDVEGHEQSVLQGMNFTRHRPWILIIEAVVPCSHIPSYQEWEHLVVDSGYRFVLADAINRFYLADEHAELAVNFMTVADNFHHYRLVWNSDAAAARVQEMETELQALRDRITASHHKGPAWRILRRRVLGY